MQHHEGTIEGFKGLQLYYQSWSPEDVPTKAIVGIVHGLGGHGGQFDHALSVLVPQGYAVYALDLRGHGRSPGQRGHIYAWREFRADVGAFLKQINQQAPGCACFLWGHSLGGTICLDYALRSPDSLQGLILTAPALGKINFSRFKLTLGQLLSRTLPRFSLKSGIRRDFCAQDARICAAYAQDPLRHEYGSARLATEFLATVTWIQNHAAELQVPLLLMHGSADQVTLPEGSRAFFQKVTFADKEYHEYPENYHDLHVDVSHQEVLNTMRLWIDRHLKTPISCKPGVTGCRV